MTGISIATCWLGDAADPDEEVASLAEVTISVHNTSVTGIFDPHLGAAFAGPRLPIFGLAMGIAEAWWSLLYEPHKVEGDARFEARHRLDAYTRGYVFPPLGLWSTGDTITAGLFAPDLRYQRQRFFLSETRGPWPLIRPDAEAALSTLITDTVERTQHTAAGKGLKEVWQQIIASAQDADERTWCINAGRLGLNPYDPDSPNLERISDGLSEQLFGDICEASEASELVKSCEWAKVASIRLQQAPEIHLRSFGAPPRQNLGEPGWRDGYDAARTVRSRLNLPQDPRQAIGGLLQGTESSETASLRGAAPPAMEGLARRQGHTMRIAVPSMMVRQRRFRLCRAVYMGWRIGQNGETAVTTADTRRQQASRAFAAELLAPAELIRERTRDTGLTQGLLERLSTDWVCPQTAIIHQAENHGIPLRGVHNPRAY